MTSFYKLLVNVLIAAVTNNYVWFALTFWVYLETRSVLATSVIAGIFLVNTAVSGFWFGSIVDHNKKKLAMLISSFATLVLFSGGFLIYITAPDGALRDVSGAWLWSLVLILMFGVSAGNIRNIALPTTVTILVPEDKRDRANGMSGTVMGVAFAITSFGSGLVLANGGMRWVLVSAIVLTAIAIVHLAFIAIPEKKIAHSQEKPKKLDIKGTISAIRSIPGLFALIFFATFNNFLGGVFMSLMDAYGLSLVSVQVWGALCGFLSLGFIFGGLYVAKKGLGNKPLRTMFRVNIVLWTIAIFFTIQPSIILLGVGMFFWICLIPFVEAAEQTIIQKVVPYERQGRVFGFAQSVEQAASPITAFTIGPIAQFIFIPFMTTGKGVDLIGGWYGTGIGRGIALVFSLAGVIGLITTLIAMRSRAYKLLAAGYEKSPAT
ncbi:MAG TPA: MFS transporter [Pyrinomonadaceae bacterium]|nr:MFS transporter [Pyrinomonadaceae bacterium]